MNGLGTSILISTGKVFYFLSDLFKVFGEQRNPLQSAIPGCKNYVWILYNAMSYTFYLTQFSSHYSSFSLFIFCFCLCLCLSRSFIHSHSHPSIHPLIFSHSYFSILGFILSKNNHKHNSNGLKWSLNLYIVNRVQQAWFDLDILSELRTLIRCFLRVRSGSEIKYGKISGLKNL